MENLISIGYSSVEECSQSPIITNVEIIVNTTPPIIFDLDEPDEYVTYTFDRNEGEPENLVSKSIMIESYRVTESSQTPMIEYIYGKITLVYYDGTVEILNFDLEEQ